MSKIWRLFIAESAGLFGEYVWPRWIRPLVVKAVTRARSVAAAERLVIFLLFYSTGSLRRECQRSAA